MFGATESVAELVADALQARLGREVLCLDASWFDFAELHQYDLVVLGACTWNIGQLPYGWSSKLPGLAGLDLTGKSVALFGTGDQVGYPETFLDALGMVADAARAAGARLIGAWPTDGYDFTGSLALDDAGRFVGLALDEDNQETETLGRIGAWVEQLLTEFGHRHTAPTASRAAAVHG